MTKQLDFTLDIDAMIEGIEDFAEYTDSQIDDVVNYYADIAKDEFVREVNEQAENNVYPRFGRSTSHIIETEEEYLEYRLGDLDAVYAEEVKNAFEALKARRDALAHNDPDPKTFYGFNISSVGEMYKTVWAKTSTVFKDEDGEEHAPELVKAFLKGTSVYNMTGHDIVVVDEEGTRNILLPSNCTLDDLRSADYDTDDYFEVWETLPDNRIGRKDCVLLADAMPLLVKLANSCIRKIWVS